MVDAGSAAKGFVYNASATTPHYVYDANGNLVQDKHKDLFINYNPYNLPNSINNSADSYITITYTADGEKLTKVAGGATRSYVAGIEYLGANLDAIYHAEGRCTPNGATLFHYEYTLKDHLGNARVNFRANGAAVTFLEEMHYYPFGMLMEGIGTAAVTVNGYKYNYKEINTDLGLNWSDYGARWYDASVGRFTSVDPLLENVPEWSGYIYVADNPVKFIDPDGRQWVNPYWEEFMRESRKNTPNLDVLEKLAKLGNKTEEIICDVERNDPELYNYIDNLKVTDPTLTGIQVNVRVHVFLSKEGINRSREGEAAAITKYSLLTENKYLYRGKTIRVPYLAKGDEYEIEDGGTNGLMKGHGMGFNIFLYDKTARTLVNEIGDVMYAMEYNDEAYQEYKRQKNAALKQDYFSTPSARYSFAVEETYMRRSRGEFNNAIIYPLIWSRKGITTQNNITITK